MSGAGHSAFGASNQRSTMLKIIHRMACLLTSLVVVSSVHAAASNVDWPLIGGNAGVWHYSPLKQINDQNVKQLGLAWMADIPSRDGLVGNPLGADGVVYQSGHLGRVYANDVRTGKPLWRFAPEVKFTDKTSLATFWSS